MGYLPCVLPGSQAPGSILGPSPSLLRSAVARWQVPGRSPWTVSPEEPPGQVGVEPAILLCPNACGWSWDVPQLQFLGPVGCTGTRFLMGPLTNPVRPFGQGWGRKSLSAGVRLVSGGSNETSSSLLHQVAPVDSKAQEPKALSPSCLDPGCGHGGCCRLVCHHGHGLMGHAGGQGHDLCTMGQDAGLS